MLSRILGWFGNRSENGKSAPGKRVPGRQSSTAHLFDKRNTEGGKAAGHSPDSQEGGFNPYDTGKFDRSASWERISKTQR